MAQHKNGKDIPQEACKICRLRALLLREQRVCVSIPSPRASVTTLWQVSLFFLLRAENSVRSSGADEKLTQ